MIECLTDWIGLVNVTPSNSGRYVNDHPGLTTHHIEQITDVNERTSVSEMWSVIYNRAIRLFESDLMFRLKKYFKNYQIQATDVTAILDEDTLLSLGNKFSGWFFDITDQYNNAKIQIESIGVYLDTYAEFTIRIYNANNGQIIESFPASGIEGYNEIKINRAYAIYKYSRIFIAYDTSEIQPFKLDDASQFGLVKNASITNTSNVVHTDFDISADDIGMLVTYSIKCSIDNFVCQRLDLFTTAFWYKCGIESLLESKYSDRWNRYTLLDLEQTAQRLEELNLQYENAIDATLRDLQMPCDECFDCQKGITRKSMIP